MWYNLDRHRFDGKGDLLLMIRENLCSKPNKTIIHNKECPQGLEPASIEWYLMIRMGVICQYVHYLYCWVSIIFNPKIVWTRKPATGRNVGNNFRISLIPLNFENFYLKIFKCELCWWIVVVNLPHFMSKQSYYISYSN